MPFFPPEKKKEKEWAYKPNFVCSLSNKRKTDMLIEIISIYSPGNLAYKESTCNAGDASLIPG